MGATSSFTLCMPAGNTRSFRWRSVQWKQWLLMQTVAKYWPFLLILARSYSFRKGLCSLKVSEQYVRTHVPKDSSLSLIRIPLVLLLPGCKATEWAGPTKLLLTSSGLRRWHHRKSQEERNRAKEARHSTRKGKASKGWRDINMGKQESKKTIKITLAGSAYSSKKELAPEA